MSSSREELAAFGQALTASQLTRFNPPGLNTLSYRGATYQNALVRMLARLPVETVAPEDGFEPPLAYLNVEAADDWAVALLHAWAVVTDVLSFYQERIINEGYLRTATERRSVLELARSIGYELRPGVAASTYLAFTVQVGHAEPPRRVDVPAYTAVQGMSPTGQLPQVFETSGALTARSEWNLLRPVGLGATCWEHDIHPETKSLRLLGNRTDLQPDDPVLILGENEERWRLVRLVAVEPDVERGFTIVRWENDPDAAREGVPLRRPRLFAMRQQASLFGYTPTGVYLRAKEDVRWRPAGIGLPDTAVQMLLANEQGHLFAATEKDIFRSFDQGATWVQASTGLIEKSITALTVGDDGEIWAGSDEGEVFLSRDDGDNWRVPAGDRVVLPVRGLKKLVPAMLTSHDHLPETVIHALATYRDKRKYTVAAATDDGVFLSSNQGRSWKPANLSLPQLDRKTGSTGVAVRSLTTVKRGKRTRLYAGTDAGVFPIRQTPGVWPVVALSLIVVVLQRLYSLKPAPMAEWLLKLAKSILSALQHIPDLLKNLVTSLTQAVPSLEEPLHSTIDTMFKPIASLKLPSTLKCLITKVNLEPPWLNDIVSSLLKSPYFWFVVDVALVFVIITTMVVGWWLVRRYLYNRPGRRIRGPRVSGEPGLLGRAPAKTALRGLLGGRLETSHVPVPVQALIASRSGQLFAGTPYGVYRSNDPDAWRQGRWLGRIFGRLIQWLFPDLSRNWNLIKPDVNVRSLVRTADELVAGTATGGVWRSDDNGDSWASQRAGLGLQDVQAITVTATGLYAGGTPIDAKVDTQWSPFHLRDKEIHLDAVYSDLAPEGWALLQQKDRSAHARLYRITGAATAESRDLAQLGPFTNLRVEDSAGLDGFDRETANVLAGSLPLELYDDKPVCGVKITLNRFVPGLESGHRLIVSGQPKRARLVGQPTEHARLTSADGLQQVELQPRESFQVLAPPPELATGDGETSSVGHWHLRNREGFEGTIPAGTATFVLEPAPEEDRLVAETAVIRRAVESDPDHTTIELEQPLRYVYDRPSVAIYGNVVHATHGRTVRDEVLGSGAGWQANQRFRLRQGPLTFVSAPTASGLATTLAMQVNGVTWHQVPFLYGLDRDSRAYIVRQDARENTSVIFGDGHRGARLPSGHEQITASYRIGLGPEANVPAGSLSQLQTALPGIESVTNPLPATGGVGPEKLAQARQNAPLTVRAMRRVVSLADFEDFVRRFAGVGKAQARLLHVGPRQVLHITIADGEGQPIPKTSDLYHMLVQAIDENRGTPQPRVYLDSYEPVYFNLRARLLIDPDHRERQRDIQAAVRSRISRSFAFDAREFGQGVSASELISLMQDTPGVVAVELVHLHRSTQGASLAAALEASPARWHDGRPLPAQMLLVNSQTGITLNVEVAA
jgi:hypothetical protein